MKKQLVAKKIIKVEDILHALAHHNRLLIISYLTKYHHASVGAIADAITESFHNTSKHLGILERSGIITYHEEGLYRMYKLEKRQHDIVKTVLKSL